MTTPDVNIEDPFAFLAAHEYVVMTTYRHDGTPVPTTVWFANDNGKVYVTTFKNAGKIKRIRDNGRVSMTPSGRMGELLGEPEVVGQGRDAALEERAAARAALAHKYGEQFEKIVGQENPDRVYIVIESV
ncbi:PPOX class F420-dependent oxidoreductase [Dictyobacter arantiisoli]|uniref:PPOX class F420-dependent oxidoreductase n=1 Tax=Dictyobacter arantiisoli TaxID=2014874 RepID=A0A5A5TDY9_9CHLR|nr:PPOX class F420-dependent oxidoreductase [Dictyobacter arantiisoli]GCF09632.1 PPOX class F420-dependent oxidoreductase [Dictyobacter arantiisoli]